MADFFTDAKFGVDTGQIPALNLGGANALQTAATNIASNTQSKTGGVEYYRYPRQAMTESTDYLYLKVVKFKPPVFTVTEAAPYITTENQTQAQSQNELVSGHVILPMPQSIGDANSVEWGSSSLNPLEAAGLAAAATGIKGGISGIVDVVKGGTKFVSDVGTSNPTTNNLGNASILALQSAIAGKVVNFAGGNVNIKSIVARTTGQVLNPNQELLFDGPSLRSFSFIFDLAPRYSEEGLEIMKMIRFLKKSMAAKSTKDGFFLQAPDLFKIKYMSGKNDHPFLNRFKVCALTNMTVNYTGSNTYSTYDDGTPVHLQLGLNFNEINPIYAQEYDQEGLNGVGY